MHVKSGIMESDVYTQKLFSNLKFFSSDYEFILQYGTLCNYCRYLQPKNLTI